MVELMLEILNSPPVSMLDRLGAIICVASNGAPYGVISRIDQIL